MDDFLKKQKVKQLFSNLPFKSGEVFRKNEMNGQISQVEILTFLGKQFGIQNAYAVKANISYFQSGADSFSVKTEQELQTMIEREGYRKIEKTPIRQDQQADA